MNTHLLALEAHDDLVSVRDRMSWAKTPRILLVWPKGRKIALRPIDLKILQRHAASLGAELGLVTRDDRIRREAAALNIPIFESTGAAQREEWPVRLPKSLRLRKSDPAELRARRAEAQVGESGWRASPLVRIGAFALGGLAVLTVAGLFVPRGRVALFPESQTQSIVIPVVADPSVSSVFITGTIPSRRINLEVILARAGAVTGSLSVPQSEAEGLVRFRNLTEASVPIPAGTIVRTQGSPPVRFVTTDGGATPEGIGETVDIPIQSLGQGAAGNLDADQIQAIEGSLGLLLAVTNPEPTTGGSGTKSPAPSEEDRADLREATLAELNLLAVDEARGELQIGDLVFPDSVVINNILEETYDPPAGQAATRLTLTLRADVTVSYASAEDLNHLADLALSASLPEGFIPVRAEYRVPSSLAAPVTDEDGITRWQMPLERRLLRQVNLSRVLQLMLGRSPESARQSLLAAFDWEDEPQITVSPSWWPWLPIAPFQIDVVMQ
ncbi:MAG: baseplate J/gp47 family protein [Chloroflexota bacterium]